MRLPLPCLAFCSLVSLSTAAEVPAPIRLDGPEVARLAWDTRSMVAADFDRDGKLDVAVINNENAKLVLLYQRVPGSPALSADRRAVARDRWEPQLEDSRFQKVSLPADQRHFALVAGDFDGDGRPDVALTGASDALTVRFQGEAAGFSKSWTYRNFEPLQGNRSLLTADLDQDGKADLAVLAKNKLLVFRQQPGGGFGEPVVYLTTEDKAGYLMAEDVDGDKDLDLLYLAGSLGSRITRSSRPSPFKSPALRPAGSRFTDFRGCTAAVQAPSGAAVRKCRDHVLFFSASTTGRVTPPGKRTVPMCIGAPSSGWRMGKSKRPAGESRLIPRPSLALVTTTRCGWPATGCTAASPLMPESEG